MANRSGAVNIPDDVLLATDLSSRCDRALDRALLLAREWNVELHVVHCISDSVHLGSTGREVGYTGRTRALLSQAHDQLRLQAERQLYRALPEAIDERQIRIHVEQGSPGQVICEIAEREDCGLIVTGVARNETLGRMILGDTVDYLIRKAPVPVLVVRNRVYGAYKDVLAATDFSAASAKALRTARSLFQASDITLYHAYDIPFSGFLTGNDAIRAEYRELAEKAAVEFLRSEGLPQATPRKIVHGSPATGIATYLEDHNALVVVGARGASAIAGVLLGSTASRILDNTLADVLVVPFTECAAKDRK